MDPTATVPITPVVVEVPVGVLGGAVAAAEGTGPEVEPRASTSNVYLELAKPGITKMVTLTAAVGFLMGMFGRSFTAGSLTVVALGCIVGTALSSAGANALNQWLERRRDGLMNRTATRPLPSGRMRAATAFWTGTGLCAAGIGVLYAACGQAAAGISLATIICYVLIYTPLKPITAWNTIVGAVPGALPPLIGFAAAAALTHTSVAGAAWAGGTAERPWLALAEPAPWALFALMFVWQLPHFFAIAWMHKEDYARGEFAMLPVMDDTGRLTSALVAFFAAVLVPASVAPMIFMPDRLGWAYAIIAIGTGVAFFVMTLRFVARPTRLQARRVFLASIMHLPILLVAIVAEVVIRALFLPR